MLGPNDRGAAYLAMLLPSLASVFLTAGLSNSIVRFVAQDRTDASTAVGVINLAAIASVGVALMLSWLAPSLASIIGLREEGLLRIGGLLVVAQTYMILITFLLLALDSIAARNAMIITQAVVYFGMAIVLLIGKSGPASLVTASVVGYVVAGVVGATYVARVTSPLRFRVSIGVLSRYVTFGLRGQLGQLAQYFNYRLDALILGGLAGSGAVGIYAVATSLAEIVSHISNAAATVAFPRFAGSNSDEAQVGRVLRITLAAAAAGAAGLAIGGLFFIPPIFGAEFRPAVLPFLILLPGTLSLAVVKILSAAFVGRGAPGLMTIATLASLVMTIALDVALIPVIGVMGAALASTVAYAVGALVCLTLYRRLARAPLRDLLLVRADDVRAILRPIR